MKKAKSQSKTTSAGITKELRAHISQLIEKGLKKTFQKIVSLEKALNKMKGTKQKPLKSSSPKKATAATKPRAKKRAKKARVSAQDLD